MLEPVPVMEPSQESEPVPEQWLVLELHLAKDKVVNYLPTSQVSPGQGDLADPTKVPCIAWTQVVNRRTKPPVTISEDIIGKDTGIELNADADIPRLQDQLDDEDMTIVRKSVDDSSKIVGVRPITGRMI